MHGRAEWEAALALTEIARKAYVCGDLDLLLQAPGGKALVEGAQGGRGKMVLPGCFRHPGPDLTATALLPVSVLPAEETKPSASTGLRRLPALTREQMCWGMARTWESGEGGRGGQGAGRSTRSWATLYFKK